MGYCFGIIIVERQMENLPAEILQYICDFLDAMSQIIFRTINRLNYSVIRITDLYHIPEKYRRRLNDNILRKYQYVKYLYSSRKITDISYLTNLVELNAPLGTLIGDAQTLLLQKLEKLVAKSNEHFIDINHLQNLKILNISDNCMITNIGIQNCTNLIKLNINHTNINNINHLVNLRELNCAGSSLVTEGCYKCTNLESIICTAFAKKTMLTEFNCFTNLRKLITSSNEFIKNENISQCLNLTELDVSYTNISDLNNLTNLQRLRVSGCEKLTHVGIERCVNLIKLQCYGSTNITKINHLTKLEHLIINETCKISEIEVNKCTTLKKLSVRSNKKIKNINYLTNLTTLEASGNSSGVTQNGIRECTNLVKLKIDGNQNIKSVNHLQKLKYLYAQGICGIDDLGIKKCTKLVLLDLSYNIKVKNLNHLQDLKFLYACGRNCGVSDKGISECKSLIMIKANNNTKIKKKTVG